RESEPARGETGNGHVAADVAALADHAEDGRVEQGEDPARVAVEPAAAAGLDDVPGDVRSVEDDAERLGRDQISADVEALRRGRPRLVPAFLGRAADQGRAAPDVEV